MAPISRASRSAIRERDFILAHIGGGGDYAHTFPAVVDRPNIYPDLSGSGVDRGMLDAAVEALGAKRLLWGSDLTMCTGSRQAARARCHRPLARRHREHSLANADALSFRAEAFPRCSAPPASPASRFALPAG